MADTMNSHIHIVAILVSPSLLCSCFVLSIIEVSILPPGNPLLSYSHASRLLFLMVQSLVFFPFLYLFFSLHHPGTFFSHTFLEEFTKNILFFMDPKKALPSLIAGKRETHHLFIISLPFSITHSCSVPSSL